MSWLRRFACWLFKLVPIEDYTHIRVLNEVYGREQALLRGSLQEAKLLNDPREHVSRECYAALEERYDVLYREHQVLKEKANASDDETKP